MPEPGKATSIELFCDLDKAIGIKPRDPDKYYNRGLVRLAKADLDGAIADYKAVETNPRSAVTYANRGLVYLLQGKIADANRDFERCLTMDASLKSLIEKNRNAVKQQQGRVLPAL